MTDHETIWRLLKEEALLDAETFEGIQQQSKKTGVPPLQLLLKSSEATWAASSQSQASEPSFDVETLSYNSAGSNHGSTSDCHQNEKLPLAGWERYQIKRFLDRGGMGEVYAAHDPRLNRMVAIKLLRNDNPASTARFVREARHQAGVSHPHICQIFETGTEQGRAYIAMQYIDGCDLLSATKGMNLEEKLQIFIQITEGLQEAHRQGLVHRDIKPGNILVEGHDSDHPHAYVLDFGLARNLHEASMTRTGDMMGTPAYMAPEQALGELHLIDRHTDIYGLGGTMYKVISGKRPIQATSDLEILNCAIQGDLRPLRLEYPSVPRDVETIVMKCLQTKARDRYGSARALGDDLTRYLKGEPILARSVSPWERIQKFTHRHKTLVRLGAVAMVLLLLTLGWGLKMRYQGQVREQLAQAFTSRVEQIEAIARYMHMAPHHDLSSDRRLIRTEMTQIEAEMKRVGKLGIGPGHFALGRGFMALNQPQLALEYLQQAWDNGFQEARVADALSRVLGAMYRNALLEVERIDREEPRQRRLQKIKASYGEPALRYATLAKQNDRVAGDVEALMAFYAGDYERAQSLLDGVEQDHPWFYELDKLSGDIFLAQANGLAKTDQEAAAAIFAKARETYAQALEVGPSDPTLYLAQAQTDYAHMLMNTQSGGSLEPHFQRGLEALEKALVVHPGWDEALLQKATFLRRKGIDARRQFLDQAQTWFEDAIATCELITKLDPAHDRANDGLARSLSQLADVEQRKGRDPRPMLERALVCFNKVGEEFRDSYYYNDLGLLYKTRADYSQGRGESAGEDRIKEIEAYDLAMTFDRSAAAPLINKASALLALAPTSQEPIPILEQGVESLEQALELSPKNVPAHYFMGILLTSLAYEKNMRGKLYVDQFLRAEQIYGQGIQLAPSAGYLNSGITGCYLDWAASAWEHGEDPLVYLQNAVKYSSDALKLSPNDYFAYFNRGLAFSIRADFMLSQGEDPRLQLVQAQDNLEKALELMPNNSSFLGNLGEVWYLKAVRDLAMGSDPTNNLSQAREILTRALTLNPQNDDGHRVLCRLHLLRMQRAFSLGQDWQEILSEALAAQEQVKYARFDKDLLTLASLRYHQARQLHQMGKDPQDAIQEGLTIVGSILQRRPLGEALALRSGLRSLQARTQIPLDDAVAAAASQDLEHALKLNPHLRTRWDRQN